MEEIPDNLDLSNLFESEKAPAPAWHLEDLPPMEFFPADKLENVQKWVEELQHIVDDKVRNMVRDKHMLVPDLETLPMHIAQTPAELFNTCRTYVRLSRLLWESEKDLQRKSRDFKRQMARVEGEASLRLRKQWAEEVSAHKGPTIAELKELLDTDPQLASDIEQLELGMKTAELAHSEIMEHKEGVHAMVRAVEFKSSLLPGLQGAANAGQRMGMGQRNFQ